MGTKQTEKWNLYRDRHSEQVGGEWQKRLWSGIIKEYGQDSKIKEILEGKKAEEEQMHAEDEERVEAAVKQVTTELMNSLMESPTRFWEVLRQMRGKGGGQGNTRNDERKNRPLARRKRKKDR